MKLLSLKISDKLTPDKQFRSLYPGFTIRFHDPESVREEDKGHFNPFCMVGLNGTGKSNVLEALSCIFFHLECCVAKFIPDSYANFRRDLSHPDAYELEYLIQEKTGDYQVGNFIYVKVVKEVRKAPQMYIRPYHLPNQKPEEVSLKPTRNQSFPVAAEGKHYLPDIIVGYSSGENEILSVPFLKSRLINFDKYKEDFYKGYAFEYPENSLIYIDHTMSQVVLLSCLLFENPDALSFLKERLYLVDLLSFRININLQQLDPFNKKEKSIVTEHIQPLVESLKEIATCWYEHQEPGYNNPEEGYTVLTLDFFVDDATREAFRKLFRNSFECFRFFQILYELNIYFLPEYIKKDIYTSKRGYAQEKIPEANAYQEVFRFLDFIVIKEINNENRELSIKEFSDGEHQLLHTMGICLMLKDNRSLLLLDEPETHFNPEWRSQFIQILNHCLQAGGGNYLLKDILLTSHSAFIISDCTPDKVIIFARDEENRVTARKAEELGFKTYGTSVNLLTNRIFQQKHTIGEYSFNTVNEYRRQLESGTPFAELEQEIEEVLGDSIEKVFLVKQFKPRK